jgi:hypothetical protein
MPPLLLPEFVTEALPPVVNDSKPAADPELLVVALWFVPAALFVKGAGAVPELVQLISPAVVVQTKSAAAGELADRASSESAAAEPSVEVETKKVDLSIARRPRAQIRSKRVCRSFRTRHAFAHGARSQSSNELNSYHSVVQQAVFGRTR